MKDNFKLSDIPKHNIYQVPENYFDQLPMRVMERTAAAPEHTWQSNTVWQSLRIMAAPLVLLLVFVGVFYLNKPVDSNTASLDLASLDNQEIVNYLSTYATLESADFAELNSIQEQELTADVLNVSAKNAEEELEYYDFNQIDY